MENLDEFLASREMILRLIVTRKVLLAAAHASNVLARHRQNQMVAPHWRLLRSAEGICLGWISLGFHRGARWGGLRLGIRTPKKRLRSAAFRRLPRLPM